MTTTLIIGLLIPLLASLLMPALPYMLAFAAGAMFYVVVEELIPEASEGQHSNLSTIGFAITEALLYYLIAINVVTFLVYGIDKRKAEGR